MKFPWNPLKKSDKQEESGLEKERTKVDKSSSLNLNQAGNDKKFELKNLPIEIQKIAILLQHTDKEIIYNKNKVILLTTARKEIEKELTKRLKDIEQPDKL